MKTKLIKFHFIVLLILVVNFVITNTFEIGLNSYIKILLALLLCGSGFTIFILSFKQLFKPFTLLKFYSTFFVTIPLLVLFICNVDDSCSNSTEYRLKQSLSPATPIYRQYNYEIYEKVGVLDYIRTCSGSAQNYYVDKNYFIFKIREGYFHFTYKDEDIELLNIDYNEPLKSKNLKNINVENDSIYIDFNNHIRAFKIRK